MRSQHWFRYWLGAVRQQAITWADVHPDLWCHMVSLGHNVLSLSFTTIVIQFWWQFEFTVTLFLAIILLHNSAHAKFHSVKFNTDESKLNVIWIWINKEKSFVKQPHGHCWIRTINIPPGFPISLAHIGCYLLRKTHLWHGHYHFTVGIMATPANGAMESNWMDRMTENLS